GRRARPFHYRARGVWDPDTNPKNSVFGVVLWVVAAVRGAFGAAPAIIVGTSRGGLLAMALAAQRPGAVAGAILNDIGPVIEAKGLQRIKEYVGKLPEPQTFEEAADILRRTAERQFPKLSADDGLAIAKRGWRQQDGCLLPTYHPALAYNLAAISADRPIPTMWPQFEALTRVPVMLIRGANSDILSFETVEAMK